MKSFGSNFGQTLTQNINVSVKTRLHRASGFFVRAENACPNQDIRSLCKPSKNGSGEPKDGKKIGREPSGERPLDGVYFQLEVRDIRCSASSASLLQTVA